MTHSELEKEEYRSTEYFFIAVTVCGKGWLKLGELVKEKSLNCARALDYVVKYYTINHNPYNLEETEIQRLLTCANFCEYRVDWIDVNDMVKRGEMSDKEQSEWVVGQLRCMRSNQL